MKQLLVDDQNFGSKIGGEWYVNFLIYQQKTVFIRIRYSIASKRTEIAQYDLKCFKNPQ